MLFEIGPVHHLEQTPKFRCKMMQGPFKHIQTNYRHNRYFDEYRNDNTIYQFNLIS